LLTLAGPLVTKAYSVVVVVLAADTPEAAAGVGAHPEAE
jgi:ribosomal protein S12 methylthiotransferase accessory factor YcaO